MTRKTFWTYTVIVALCGLSVSAAVSWKRHQEQPGRQLSSAAWKEKYRSTDELARRVDAIVLAEAVSVSPGRVAFSEGGEDALPFEVVQFRVTDGIKGFKSGDQVLIERAGGTDNEGHAVHVDIDGGEFEVGATYLLFLKRQEEGPYYYQVNDQGRFQVEGGRLRAVTDDEVTAELRGRPVREVVEAVKQKAKEN
jgi:hypothetical protein